MAVIETDGAVIRGKMGAMTFAYRRGVNYSRVYGKGRDPKSPAQLAQRKRYGQFQRLGSLWNRDFITPYFQGDKRKELPFNSFIKYNWARWDKESPPWQSALPFWNVPKAVNFGAVPFPGKLADRHIIKIIADVPASLNYPQMEFYGFYTVGDAAHFVKFPRTVFSGAGLRVFETGIDAPFPITDTFFICWFQKVGEAEPYCMPVNRQVPEAPSADGWKSYTCAAAFSVFSTTLTVSLFSDIPARSLFGANSGYVRFYDYEGIMLDTIKATPEAEGAERAAYAEYSLDNAPSGNLYIQAWFETDAEQIPVSRIAAGTFINP